MAIRIGAACFCHVLPSAGDVCAWRCPYTRVFCLVDVSVLLSTSPVDLHTRLGRKLCSEMENSRWEVRLG